MPDYGDPKERGNVQPDLRSTVYWNPVVNLEDGQATDQFYTSAETGEFIIYSEGLTITGEVFTGEAVFTVE